MQKIFSRRLEINQGTSNVRLYQKYMEMVKNLRFDEFVPHIDINEKLFVEKVVQGYDNIIRSEMKFKPPAEIFSLATDRDRENAAKLGGSPLLRNKSNTPNEEEFGRSKMSNEQGERSKSAKMNTSIKMTPASKRKAANEARNSATSQDMNGREESLRANSGKLYEVKRMGDDDAPENLSLNKLPSFVSHMDKDAPDNKSVNPEANSRISSAKGSSRSVKVRGTSTGGGSGSTQTASSKVLSA